MQPTINSLFCKAPAQSRFSLYSDPGVTHKALHFYNSKNKKTTTNKLFLYHAFLIYFAVSNPTSRVIQKYKKWKKRN